MDKGTIAERSRDRDADGVEDKIHSRSRHTNAAVPRDRGRNVATSAMKRRSRRFPASARQSRRNQGVVENGSLKSSRTARGNSGGDPRAFFLAGTRSEKIRRSRKIAVSSIAQPMRPGSRARGGETGIWQDDSGKTRRSIDERQKYAGSFQLGTIAAEAETCKRSARASRALTVHRGRIGAEGNRADPFHRGDLRSRKSPRIHRDPCRIALRRGGPNRVCLASGLQCDRAGHAAEYPCALTIDRQQGAQLVVRNRALNTAGP